MAKTLVDVDEDLLREAAAELGTVTKKDTINSALRDVLRRRAVARHLELMREGGFASLLDADTMRGAWR